MADLPLTAETRSGSGAALITAATRSGSGAAHITAATMARAAKNDPQFSVPVRPRLRRGLVVRLDGDQLVVDGIPTRHVLRGQAATTLVPRLLPLLDGRRDHDAVAAAAGVSVDTVFAALSLLWTTGLVEEAAPDGVDVAWVPDHLADLLSRTGDATEANPAWEQAAVRLAAARVRVHGDPVLAGAIAAALDGTLPVALDDADKPDPEATLVILAGPHRPVLADACWSAGVPLLRVRLDGDEIEIGPYVDRALSPCFDCLADDDDGEPDFDPDRLPLAAGLAASDIVALVSRSARVGLPLRWRRVHLNRLGQAVRTGATRPGCPTCATAPAPPGTAPGVSPLSARYEAAVALPPREYADVKAHQLHYQPANVAVQREHKTWPASPVTVLPVPDVDRLAGPPAGRRAVTLLDVSTVLMVTAGWQKESPERVWRWSATGGNIGSVVAHLLVRDLPGLAPGTYGYVPSWHALSLLRDEAPPACPDACGAPVCLLLTADLARVAGKYSAFGLRVVMLDAGCAHTAALATANQLGVAATVGVEFADRAMSDLLGTDPDAEPVTGLIHLGGSE